MIKVCAYTHHVGSIILFTRPDLHVSSLTDDVIYEHEFTLIFEALQEVPGDKLKPDEWYELEVERGGETENQRWVEWFNVVSQQVITHKGIGILKI